MDKDLRARMQALIDEHDAAAIRARADAIAKVQETILALGITMEEIQAPSSPRARAQKPVVGRNGRKPVFTAKKKAPVKTPRPIKYRDPETGDTWTGASAPPNWVKARLAENRTLEEFLIKGRK
jgi:DNA-binding protein H-NS